MSSKRLRSSWPSGLSSAAAHSRSSSATSSSICVWIVLSFIVYSVMRADWLFQSQAHAIFLRELNIRGGHVLFQMLQRRRAGNGQHHRRAREQPRKPDLEHIRAVRFGDDLQLGVVGQFARTQRKVWDERDAVLLAKIDDAVVFAAVVNVVHVLDGRDSRNLGRLDELGEAHVR